MRKITDQEAKLLLKDFCWGTLCSVTLNGNPYAIEFSYFTDSNRIYAIINPRGQTAKNIKQNPNICFKICDTDKKTQNIVRFHALELQNLLLLIRKKKLFLLGKSWLFLLDEAKTLLKRHGIGFRLQKNLYRFWKLLLTI